jgi:hypothetical protein
MYENVRWGNFFERSHLEDQQEIIQDNINIYTRKQVMGTEGECESGSSSMMRTIKNSFEPLNFATTELEFIISKQKLISLHGVIQKLCNLALSVW